MSLFFIALFAFLAATSLIVVVVLLVTAVQTSPQARIRRRLMAISRSPYASPSEVQSILKGSLYSDIPWVNDILKSINFVRAVNVLLERANLDISVSLFLLISCFCGGVVFFLIGILGDSFSLALLGGAVSAFVPYVYVKYLTLKRLRRFLEQMPDALDMIGQGLQAGLGLTQSMAFVAKEMPDPIGTEFSVFMEEVNLGLPLADGLKGFQERMPLADVRLFGVAMMVQREVGGALAELLNKLSDVIRDRFRIERQIKALTAQNRLSAWVVCAIPPILAFFMFSMDPDLMREMWANPLGRTMYISASVLEIIGIVTFRQLIRVHI